jgi:hypothetical protein
MGAAEMRSNLGLCLLTALVIPGLLAGQGVRGSVVDETGRPIVNALVEVSTPSGEVVARGATTQVGTYLVRLPTAGVYQLRVRAIGYAQVRTSSRELSTALIDLPVIRMTETVVVLPEVVARSSEGRCSSSPGTGLVMAPLLDAAASALEVMERTLSLDNARHTVELVHRRAIATRRDSVIEADTTRLSELMWPVVSADAERLRLEGFGHEPTGARTGRWTFFGPDASVLFADWFLSEHCFDVVDAEPDAGTVVVRFEPNVRGGKIRLSGRLVLDAKSLALRELHFEHRNLPSHMPGGSAGGAVYFVSDATGGWRPDRWVMRAPLTVLPPAPPMPIGSAPRANPLPRPPRVVGSIEVFGRVVGN